MDPYQRDLRIPWSLTAPRDAPKPSRAAGRAGSCPCYTPLAPKLEDKGTLVPPARLQPGPLPTHHLPSAWPPPAPGSGLWGPQENCCLLPAWLGNGGLWTQPSSHTWLPATTEEGPRLPGGGIRHLYSDRRGRSGTALRLGRRADPRRRGRRGRVGRGRTLPAHGASAGAPRTHTKPRMDSHFALGLGGS